MVWGQTQGKGFNLIHGTEATDNLANRLQHKSQWILSARVESIHLRVESQGRQQEIFFCGAISREMSTFVILNGEESDAF